MIRTLPLAAALLLAAACGEAPAPQQCEQMLEHVIELELAGSDGDLADKKAKLTAQVSDELIAYCEKEIPRRRVRCALKAKDKEALALCDLTPEERAKVEAERKKAEREAKKAEKGGGAEPAGEAGAGEAGADEAGADEAGADEAE